MDFNPGDITSPFRMQPGLRKLACDEVRLTRLVPGSAIHAAKAAVVAAGQDLHCVAGFDPTAALEAIAAHGSGFAPAHSPAMYFEEDFAVLDGSDGTIPWMNVCLPSHWAPEDKIGLDFAAIHAPVADNAAIVQVARQLVQLVTAGDCWQRHVWTISPSARHDQHPRRTLREPWPRTASPDEFVRHCHLRVERQSFFPVLPRTDARRQAVFAIRVMLEPLTACIQDAAAARALSDALASMSDAVIAYKGLGPARDPVRQWLSDSYRL